ncbi:MAG TPA: lipopolysaccharide core heptose(II) kinase RfaY, partial [bacterium]|nr:lipopolysaccharide core heptose(II) kinase RfaY [bacterium]
DFVQEARNIDRFKNHFQDNPGVRIPQVYWDFCSSKVVTMEYIDGIGIADVEKIEKAGLDRKEIARKGAEITLKQIFEYGFFHGDPHPGNLFVLEDNVIAPMDFGLVGNLDRELRNSLAQLMSGFVHKNIDRIVRVLYNMGVINSKLDEGALKLDISELIERYYQLEIRHVNVNQIMEDVTRLVTKYKIKLPKNLFLMTKAMSLMESIARQLDPKFNMVKVSKPYVQSFMIKRWSPKNIAEEVSLCIEDVLDLVETSPRTIKRILQQIKRGRLGFNLHHEELSRFIHMLDKASNRISFSLIIAALIIASSVLVNFGKGPLLFGIPAIGLIGYLIAAIMGLWLVIAILRSGRL